MRNSLLATMKFRVQIGKEGVHELSSDEVESELGLSGDNLPDECMTCSLSLEPSHDLGNGTHHSVGRNLV